MKILKQGNKGTQLSYRIYKKLETNLGFPKINTDAIDINYIYRYDGYLPKFIFNLCYKVPVNCKVLVYEENNNGTIKIQTCLEDKYFKTVKYTEFQE